MWGQQVLVWWRLGWCVMVSGGGVWGAVAFLVTPIWYRGGSLWKSAPRGFNRDRLTRRRPAQECIFTEV